MGILRLLLGSKIAGKMACFDIAKPLTLNAVKCSRLLVQFKEFIPENERRQALMYTAMMYCHYFMHCFNRQYFLLYGSQKLEMAQRMLFPIIAFEFNKQFDGNIVKDDTFFELYNDIELQLGVCGQIRSSDGSFKFTDQDSALSVFANGLCKSIFGESQSSNPVIIATIAKEAEDGMDHIVFPPKLIELSRWC